MFLGTTCEELHGPEAMQKLGRIRSICNEREKTNLEEIKVNIKKKKNNSKNKFIPLDNEYDRGTENHDPLKLRYYVQPQGQYCIAKLYPGGKCPPDSHSKMTLLVCGCLRKNGLQDINDQTKNRCLKQFPWLKDGTSPQSKTITCYREIEEAKAEYERQLMCQRYCDRQRAMETCCNRRESRDSSYDYGQNKNPVCYVCYKCMNGLDRSN